MQTQKINLTETQNQRVFWGTIGLAGIELLLSVYTIISSTKSEMTSGDYVNLAVMIFMAGISIASLVLAFRQRQETGFGLAYSIILIMSLGSVLSSQGQAMSLSTLILIVALLLIGSLSPRPKRIFSIATVVTLVLMWVTEVINPSWRLAASSASTQVEFVFGILFGIILGIYLLRQAMQGSLRIKLITAFLATAVIPLAILAFINDNSTRAALTNEANQALSSAASQTAVQLDTFMNNGLDTIRTQASLKVVSDYLSLPASQRAEQNTNILAFLTTLARQNPVYISSVAICNIKGVDIADTFTSDVGSDKSDRDWFKKALETELPYVSNVEFSQTTDEASFYFSAPVRNTAGDIIGVIRTRYNANALQQIISSNNNLLGQGSFAVLMDAQTHVRLAHGTTPSIIFKSVVPLDAKTISDLQARRLLPSSTPEELSTNLPEFEAALDNYATQPFFSTELRIGDDTLEQGAIVNMKTQEWHVIYAQEQAQFLAPINEQARANLVLALIVAAVVAGFAVIISATLAGPIVRLTKVAESIAGGDINIQANVESGDEIGRLAGTFNRMTQQLREFITTLEQRVADRTRALATTSEVSRRLSTILNRKELVTEVVNQVRGAFGYYHTQIYFFDEAHENLVMAGGTGEVGRMMLAQFHKLAKGRGLVGRAADSNKPVLVSDTSQNPEWLPNPLLPDTKSEVAIPIAIGDEVLGVMDVQHNIANGLQQEDIDSLQSIANQVAVAYQNIRQYENSQKVANDLNVVANVGIATATITDIDRLLQEVVDLSKKSFNLYHAHIYLVNETGDTLVLTAGAGEVGRKMVSEGRHIQMDAVQSLVARAARTHQGVVVNDVTATPDFLPNPLLPDTRSELAVPMIVAGKVIGVLDVQSETANRFTEVDVNIKTTLASQVAVALQNARSFQQTQKQAEREAAVNLITQKIQGTTSIETALKVAARELGHLMGMKQTIVSLNENIAGKDQD
jgi:GAF domain-containing protein/HAMP domain-containing protein